MQNEEVELYVLKRQCQFKELKGAVIKSKRVNDGGRRLTGGTESDS